MTAATSRDIFVEGFTGSANTDICYEMQLALQNSDGTPMDIDGATSSFKAKKSYSDGSALITVTENTGIEVDANNSIITMQLLVSDFVNVPLNRESTDMVYDWDMVLDGRRFRLLRGTLTVGGDI